MAVCLRPIAFETTGLRLFEMHQRRSVSLRIRRNARVRQRAHRWAPIELFVIIKTYQSRVRVWFANGKQTFPIFECCASNGMTGCLSGRRA